MKKTKICLIATLMTLTSLIFFSCNSTEVPTPSAADDYADQVEVEKKLPEVTEETTIQNTKPAENSLAYEIEKKNAFQQFFTFGNKDEIIPFDTTSFFTPKVFGGLYQQPATILIHLKDKTAGFGSKYQSAYYIVQFSDESRQALTKGFENYLSDFANKRLNRKNHNSLRAYGKIPVKILWGSVSSSTPNYGYGEMKIGYEFYKGSPYFVLSCNKIENEKHKEVGDAAMKESMPLTYYFNKELGNDIVSKLSNENVSRYYADVMGADVIPSAADEY